MFSGFKTDSDGAREAEAPLTSPVGRRSPQGGPARGNELLISMAHGGGGFILPTLRSLRATSACSTNASTGPGDGEP